MRKPTGIVVSCESEFYWRRPVSMEKCEVLHFGGRQRHHCCITALAAAVALYVRLLRQLLKNKWSLLSHVALSQHLLSFLVKDIGRMFQQYVSLYIEFSNASLGVCSLYACKYLLFFTFYAYFWVTDRLRWVELSMEKCEVLHFSTVLPANSAILLPTVTDNFSALSGYINLPNYLLNYYGRPMVGGSKQCCNRFICLSVCLSVCSMYLANKWLCYRRGTARRACQ